MSTLPDWMRPDADRDLPPAPAAARRSILRPALASFARVVEQMVADDATAGQPGLLQRIDPRAKVTGLFGLIVVATLVRTLPALILALCLCLALAVISFVPFRRLLGVWVVVPIFTGVIMLPATLNLVSHGHPVWTLWHFTRETFGPWRLPEALAVTDTGLLAAIRMVLRTGVCVSFAMLLTATTRPARLFHGLRALRVPVIFVMLLTMMERYLGVILRAAEEIHLAKLSRTLVPGRLRDEQRWVAAGMGSLFRRTHALGNTVYLAMLSRGYTGEIHLLTPPRWRRADLGFLLGMAACVVILLIIG